MLITHFFLTNSEESCGWGFSGGLVVKNPPFNAGELGVIRGARRSPGEGDGNPLQYSCLGNPMAGGAWWAIVHGVAKSWTRLRDFTFTFHFHALEKEMATHSSTLACREAWWATVHGVTKQTQLGDQRTILWVTGRSISSHYCHYAKGFLLQRQNMASPNSREEQRGTCCPWQPGLASIMNHCGLILTGPVTA